MGWNGFGKILLKSAFAKSVNLKVTWKTLVILQYIAASLKWKLKATV